MFFIWCKGGGFDDRIRFRNSFMPLHVLLLRDPPWLTHAIPFMLRFNDLWTSTDLPRISLSWVIRSSDWHTRQSKAKGSDSMQPHNRCPEATFVFSTTGVVEMHFHGNLVHIVYIPQTFDLLVYHLIKLGIDLLNFTSLVVASCPKGRISVGEEARWRTQTINTGMFPKRLSQSLAVSQRSCTLTRASPHSVHTTWPNPVSTAAHDNRTFLLLNEERTC